MPIDDLKQPCVVPISARFYWNLAHANIMATKRERGRQRRWYVCVGWDEGVHGRIQPGCLTYHNKTITTRTATICCHIIYVHCLLCKVNKVVVFVTELYLGTEWVKRPYATGPHLLEGTRCDLIGLCPTS